MAEIQTNNTLLAHSAPPLAESTPLAAIQQAISSIQFGVVQITIQDGRIVQIDKTEKIRLV